MQAANEIRFPVIVGLVVIFGFPPCSGSSPRVTTAGWRREDAHLLVSLNLLLRSITVHFTRLSTI